MSVSFLRTIKYAVNFPSIFLSCIFFYEFVYVNIFIFFFSNLLFLSPSSNFLLTSRLRAIALAERRAFSVQRSALSGPSGIESQKLVA